MDQETNLEPKMQKSGVGKWLIAALIVVVLAGIATTAFVMLKSQDPMKLYLSAYQKTLQEQTERYEQYYGDVLAHQERLYDEAYQSKTTVTADFELQGDAAQSMPQIAMVKAILSQIQLEMDQQVDPGAKEGSMDVALTLAGQTQASVELYQNETTTAVRAPFLYEKYFALPNDKAGAFMERMGQPEPEVTEIPNFVDMNSLSYGDLKSVLKDSLATAAGLLRKDQFTLENNATYEGETYKKITLQLSEDEAKQMLTAVLEQLKSDQRIQDFFETQMVVNRLSASTEPSFTDYQEMIDQALKNVEKVKFPSGVTIESYVKDGYIAHETMTADIGFEDEAPSALPRTAAMKIWGTTVIRVRWKSSWKARRKGLSCSLISKKGKVKITACTSTMTLQ